MSSKRNSINWAGPRRLPSVRERISNFMRRASAKNATKFLFRETQHELAPSEHYQGDYKNCLQVQVDDFGPPGLDIDLQMLETCRISDSWIESQSRNEAEQQQRHNSVTPIADLFAKKPAPPADNSTQPKCERSVSSSRGLSASATRDVSSPTPVPSILQPSRPLSVASKPWPPPEPPQEAEGIQNKLKTTSERTQSIVAPLSEPRRMVVVPSWTNSDLQHAVPSYDAARRTTTGPIIKSGQYADAVARRRVPPPHEIKRHSMPTSMPSSAGTQNSQVSGGSQAPSPLDRRLSWQQAPTSVPSEFVSSTESSSVSLSGSVLPARRTSTRLANDRLAWIRELEEGKTSGSAMCHEVHVLKKMQGGVADKLARFESKQQLPPLIRSTSTMSRASSIADSGYASSYGGISTARSSIDSHHASLILSNYDDSFRQKMEIVAGSSPSVADEDGEKPAVLRVTTTFVEVGNVAKPPCVDVEQAD